MTRILLIEDEEFTRQLIAENLGAAGHEVLEAEDGDQAIKILSHQKTDLVITDIVMPNREGIETIRDISSNYPGMPIIAVSGNPTYLSLADKLGADAVFCKPVNTSSLLAKIDELIARNRS